MRLKKISILILNIIFVVLWVCIQSCSLIFLTASQKNKSDEACTKVEVSFRDLFWRIESANMLMRPYEFLNSLAYKSTEEMEELGYLDLIDGKLTMEKMNIIIGSPCVCALYFEKSGYVLTASGLVRLSEYANRFATIEGAPVAVEDAVSAMPDFDILTSVQYIGDNNNYARSSVFIRKNSYYNNVSFISIISEEYFDDMLASTFLEKGGSIGIVYKGNLLYGKTVGARHSLSYFHIDVYAQQRFNFELFIGIALLSLAALTLLYVLFYKIIVKNIYNIDAKLQKLKHDVDFDRDFHIDESNIKELKEIIYLINERESGAPAMNMQTRGNLVEVCLRLLLCTSYEKEALLLLKSNGVPKEVPRRIVVANNCDELDGYRVDKKVLCIDGLTVKERNIVGGIGRLTYSLEELKVSYEEAKLAYQYATLYGKKDVYFEEIPEFSSWNVNEENVISSLKDSIEKQDREGLKAQVEEIFQGLGEDYFQPLEIYAICEKIRQTFEEKTTDNELPFPEYRGQSIVEICEGITSYIDGYTLADEKGNSANAVKFEALKKFINDNLTNPDLSLKYLSDNFHYSVSYISKLFGENDLNGYQKYVSAQRIDLAKQLLKKNMTVEKIAQTCGFRQTKTFRLVFKEHTGMTPKEYREDYLASIRENIE